MKSSLIVDDTECRYSGDMSHSSVPGERSVGYDVSGRLDTDYYDVFADVTGDEYRVGRRHPATQRVSEHANKGLRGIDAVDLARRVREQVRIRDLQQPDSSCGVHGSARPLPGADQRLEQYRQG